MARRPAILPEPRARRGEADFSLAIVNIVLLLVFFFLITGTLVESDEQQVDLAETRELPLDRLPRPLLVMQDESRWSLDGTPVSRDELARKLPEALEAAGSQVLHLLPDRDLPASALLLLMQDAAFSGVALKLVTLRVPAGGQP